MMYDMHNKRISEGDIVTVRIKVDESAKSFNSEWVSGFVIANDDTPPQHTTFHCSQVSVSDVQGEESMADTPSTGAGSKPSSSPSGPAPTPSAPSAPSGGSTPSGSPNSSQS